MANHVFGRQSPTVKGVFAADLAVVTLSDGLSPTLMQNLGLQYAQQVSRFFEIGGPGVYLIGGRTSGSMSTGHIVGPGATILAWYTKYGNVCNAGTNHLQFSAKGQFCNSNQALGLVFDVNYVVLTQLGIAVQAQEVVISESSQSMFSALEVTQQ